MTDLNDDPATASHADQCTGAGAFKPTAIPPFPSGEILP